MFTFMDRASCHTKSQVDTITDGISSNTASTYYTKTEVDVTTATFTRLIGQANVNIADNMQRKLMGLNVFNQNPVSSNPVEIRCRPDASANQASLQIRHELTASIVQAKLSFWDSSVPNSTSSNSSNALTLSWDGDADTHTSTFPGMGHRGWHDGMHESHLYGNCRDARRWGIRGGLSQGYEDVTHQ